MSTESRAPKKTRIQILNNAQRLQAEIGQIFTDADSWNEFSDARKAGAPKIDPDPDGELRRLWTRLDEFIAREMRANG